MAELPTREAIPQQPLRIRVATSDGAPTAWTSWWAALLLLCGIAIALHLAAGFTFPRPWPDESHFLAPALRLSADGTLAVPHLNAPEGIFWMPSGYYVLLAPFLAVGLDPLATARVVSLLGIVTFATALFAVASRAGVPRLVALLGAAAWVAAPRVVAAGNIARMEAPILALAGVALWLVSHNRWRGAVAVAAITPLIHPIGVVVLAAVALAGAMRARRPGWTAWERWLVAGVAVAWLLQVGYFTLNAPLVVDHVRFQLDRKTGRSLAWGLWGPSATAALALLGVLATRWWYRAPPPWMAVWTGVVLAGGFVLGELLGREIWYGVLGRETAVALAAPALLLAVPPSRRQLPHRWMAPAVAGIVAVGMVAWTLGFGWFRSTPAPGSHPEWHAFVAETVAQLQRLDAQQVRPATVLLDPLSGFGQEVFAREWTWLTFVQPTPATPRTTRGADYVMLTPGVPLRTTQWVRQRVGCEPEFRARSSHSRFRFELHAVAASPSPSRATPPPRCPGDEPARAPR